MSSCHTHSDGVSLMLHGETIPNNSLVDLDDVLYTAPDPGFNVDPSNSRPDLHDLALVCITDHVECCLTPQPRGDWHFPDGRVVQFDTGGITFRANRGQHEFNQSSGRQFYGSVRLYRRYGSPPGRGLFYCELPSAAEPSVNQRLYANICEFIS